MKKLHLVFAILFISHLSSIAQESKFRFGLKLSAQPSWLRSDNVNKVKPDGSVFGWGFGLVVDWKLTDVAYISTGLGGDFEGGNQTFTSPLYYMLNKDDEILEFADGNSKINDPTHSTFRLNKRDLRTTTVTIPVLLKLSTKEIGGFKYFGQFGGNLGILIKTRATDEIQQVYKDGNGLYQLNASVVTREDVNPYSASLPFRIGMNLGLGTEYSLSGSTSAYASINYIHQFLNTFFEDTKYYAQNIDNTNDKLKDNGFLSAYGTCIQINVGVMF